MKDENILKTITIKEVFNEQSQYFIPIYQRNYAWSNEERKQLIDDILSIEEGEEYFLGNLIVYEREENVFEVIDGQQRLTTLFILMRAIGDNISSDKLAFEARDKANQTLKSLDGNIATNDFNSPEIIEAYNFFKQQPELFTSKGEIKEEIKKKFNSVKLLRIIVPKDTDLNHYFEIMNTRGKQLEPHEVLKARLMSYLKTPQEKHVFSTVWNACSNMERYIHMSFDVDVRKVLFGTSYDNFIVDSFDDLSEKFAITTNNEKNELEGLSLLDAIKIYDVEPIKEEKTEEEASRFESIISFPNFLLQTLKVYKTMRRSETDGTAEIDGELDDKKLLDVFKADYDFAKKFCYLLIKNRYLFDRYIIKREYSGQQILEGAWSLKTLIYKKSKSDSKAEKYSIRYNNTFGNYDDETPTERTANFKQIRQIQSMFRITYTTPKVMHWLSQALIFLNKGDVNNISDTDYLKVLELYASKKVRESNYKNKSGFEFNRIVFTYLDYLLWRDGFEDLINPLSDDFVFIYRSSIEHFYPQHPDVTQGHEILDDKSLNSFGNLCLVTVSDNSKFSNQLPAAKITNPNIIKSSLKLGIMSEITQKYEWNADQIKNHEQEMYKILGWNLKVFS
ncbi:DUF262 domain-containing protein [Macrococcus brunensis]|uniref:DUF262 domain-containing protein n=1 Tax=Macrococcus brunensis TaxID=198483 RepID=UPI001EF0D971|nr:DUF262 domain-containing protein [Macrococcus brunensis]ULG72398.1 DUF262 domain-containing HNH endonuclease family protein [Macrococcus brunensis]